MLINANALHIPLADKSVHCVVTSPPYWGLRDYGVGGQLGLERTPEEYVSNMVQVFRECWRVLRDDGTLWLNIGDSYAGGSRDPNPNGKQGTNKGTVNFEPGFFKGYSPDGLKPKDLVGIPWRVAFALQQPFLRCKDCGSVNHQMAWGKWPNGRLICPSCEKSKGHEIEQSGWYLRSDIIWHKPNPMPESVMDRPTKAHEYLFLLAKQPRYYYDAEAIREEGKPKSEGRYKYEFGGPSKAAVGRFGNTRPEGMRDFMAGRNRRTVWTIPTAPYSGAHFATYPPALVEPCIKAGTSERGVCPKCGKGWVRDIERQANYEKRQDRGQPGYKNAQVDSSGWKPPTTNNKGWQPACTCDAGDPVPATVFDPFAGSGTTLMVARSLGRRGVGLDLSYRYLYENARTRLELDKLAAWHNGAASPASELSDLPMFAEVE